jgi:hypothetical protein
MQIRRQKNEQGRNTGEKRDKDQRRQDAPGAAPVEADDRKLAAFKVVQQASGDQVTRYDEKDIDAGKAAWNCRDAEMEEYNRQYRNGPKTIDIAPVLHQEALCSQITVRQRSPSITGR